MEPWRDGSARRVKAWLIRALPGWGPDWLLLTSPCLLLPFGFPSGCGSFVRPNVFAGSGQQF